MPITGPIIPAKSLVPGATPNSTTTITDSLVVPTSQTQIPDRAIQVGEIVSNVADGNLWLKKQDQSFAVLNRSKTLLSWNAVGNGITWTGNGPLTGFSALATIQNSTTGLFNVLRFVNAGAGAYFYGTIPEGSTWNSLILIPRFTVASGAVGTVGWAASIQKPTSATDVTFTTETIVSTTYSAALNAAWITENLQLNLPTGLTGGDFVRIKLRRLPETTNDTATGNVDLLSVELRAT